MVITSSSGALLSIALLLASCLIYRWLFHPLSKFPGPILAALTDLHCCFIVFYRSQGPYFQLLHREYGPIVRYAPNCLMISDPRFLPVIYHRRADKPELYSSNFGPSSIFNSLKHDDHIAAKRRVSSAYSMATARSFENKIDECLEAMIEGIRDTGSSYPLGDWLNWLAFDTQCSFLANEPLGFLKGRTDVQNIIGDMKSSRLLSFHELVGRIPVLCWLMHHTRIGRQIITIKSGSRNGVGTLMKIVGQWFEKHKDDWSQAHSRDLMDRFLSARNKDGSPIQPQDVKAEALIALVAGSITVALTVRGVLTDLLQHPTSMARAEQEIKSMFAKAECDTRPASYDEAHACPYFKACVQESLRLNGAAALFPRVVKEGGIHFDGTYIKEGMTVAASPYITMRNTDVYGDDASTYRPERWLEASAETVKEWERYDFQFGHGNRSCIGKHFALVQVYKTTLELVRHFKLGFVEGSPVVKGSR